MFEKEEQIFQVWVKHPFAGSVLQTTCGKELRILSPGTLNTDSGPDFFDARIELDGQLWVGNIEVHVRASDWLRHGHETDRAFGNVILHVVAIHDADIYDEHGNVVPVFVLPRTETVGELIEYAGRTGMVHLKTLKSLGAVKSLESYGVQRLDRRANELSVELVHLKGDMEALFQRHLFRRFGMRTNSEPFQQLAHRVPGKIIRRQKNNLDDLEALLFGQSGLLPEIPVDAYSADLLYRYIGLKSKYGLEPMLPQAWKFMRMRPSNFPTVRMSQLAVLLHRTNNLYAKCAGEAGLDELKEILDVEASEYWDDHFRFGVSSGRHPKRLGDEGMYSILINAVTQLRYFIGVRLNDKPLQEDALQMLRELPPEQNNIIRESGKRPANALESQGVLELLTNRGAREGDGSFVSEPHFPYFSKINHDWQQIYRQDRIVV